MRTSFLRSCVCLLGFLLAPTAFRAHALPDPTTEWTVDLGSDLRASPIQYPTAVPDSVLVSIGGRVVRIDATGKILFDTKFGPQRIVNYGSFSSSTKGGVYDLAVADLDGDGVEEVVSGHNDGVICALAGKSGEILWQHDLNSHLATWRMATPADLDGDGASEIIATDTNGWVTCLSHDGNLVWRSKVEEYRLSTPAVGDVNRDGHPEIIYGTATRHLICLDHLGRLVWDRFQPPSHFGRSAPLIADLDGDGRAEVYSLSSMTAPDTGLIALNADDGSFRWTGETWHKAYRGRTIFRFRDGSAGLIVCDKGGNIAAREPDGTVRWHTRVSGRGIWTAPAVADIDGDGVHEIVTSVRDRAIDGSGSAWYVLNVDGEVVGQYPGTGGQFGGPLVADIDRDGILEVVLASQSGHVTAYSFGGPDRPGAVLSSSWRAPTYPLSIDPDGAPEEASEVQSQLLDLLPKGAFGDVRFAVAAPEGAQRPALEVATTLPDGTRQIQVFRTSTESIAASWPVRLSGHYAVSLRLLDLEDGTVYAEQTLETDVPDAADLLLRTTDEVARRLNRAQEALLMRWPQAALALSARGSDLRARVRLLTERIRGAHAIAPPLRERLAEQVVAFETYADQSERYLQLVRAERQAGRRPSFVVWQDRNPWDNEDPYASLPESADSQKISHWAFGNEIESVCVNVLNLTHEDLVLRIEPGDITNRNNGKRVGAAQTITDLFRPVPLPSRFGEVVPDLLAPMEKGFLLDIPPGRVRQIWINVDTTELAPGQYRLSWPLRSLDATSEQVELDIALDVSAFALPEKSYYLTHFWSQMSAGGKSTIPDLNDHLQNVWQGPGFPPLHVNEQGELLEEPDWTKYDAFLNEAKQIEYILHHSLPHPHFPQGVEVTDELTRAAQRNFLKSFVAHLNTFGLGYENLAMYPEDETGLNGSIDRYMKLATENKTIDSQLMNYANPNGSISIDNVRTMEPITELWQPMMEIIEFWGPDFVKAMKKRNQPVLTYTPPGNVRVLRPLGFFRSQPYLSLHWGIDGGGWYAYLVRDLWGTHPADEPDYGAVDFDGRAIVPSRRWEASRDGIEDFNALFVLRRLAREKGDDRALAIFDKAVANVASQAITGMPREAADYDLDFGELMDHRLRVRRALERLSK